MENNAKKKVMIKIAGTHLTLLTDETGSFVDTVAEKVNERMAELSRNSYRVNRIDAALLCAVDFCGDKLKADKKVLNLEAQISLYDMNIRRLREEIIILKQKAGVPLDDTDLAFAKELEEERSGAASETEAGASDETSPDNPSEDRLDMKQLGELLRSTGNDTGDDKLRTLEKYLETRKKGESEGQSREEKIKYIESLLRGN